ncbi:MAG: flagellar brake protein [Lachnospiraceae bacterium]|jgi:c-di-GMP-binding flagellar brake protein YcgR|nr:flagellar brake protein [Lachnospiraceae bacterium]
MLTKFVEVGDKVEIQRVDRVKSDEKRKLYYSRVYEIISDDRLELDMPMEQGKLILLSVDTEYDLCFVTSNGFYQCFARVIDRYKENNVYLVLCELTSNLRKFQRRDYYRLSCALNMDSRPVVEGQEEEEIATLLDGDIVLSPGLPLRRSIVVDISGGGLRFVANHAYDPDMLIECQYSLTVEGNFKQYNLIGRVLSVTELPNKPGIFEHRVQYTDIDTEDREEIIRFIFEEERKVRKKDRWR